MLTWKLWRGLKRPAARNPLYQRIVNAPAQDIAWYFTCAIILAAPFLLLPAILFLSAVYGLRWTSAIAGTIAQERESGMFELISLSPPGMFGSSRAIMTACLHRNDSLAQVQSWGAWGIRMIFGLVLLMSFEILSTPIIRYDVDPFLGQIITPVYLVLLGVAVYLDHVQSIVMAELVGMIIPNYARRRTDASLGAAIVYLLLLVATYALTGFFGFAMLPPALELLPIAPQAQTILLPFIRVVIFYVIREILIRFLWQVLMRDTNAAPSDLDFMTT